MLNLIINIIICNSITVPKCFNFVTLEEDLFAFLIMIFNHIVAKTLLYSHFSLMYDEFKKASVSFVLYWNPAKWTVMYPTIVSDFLWMKTINLQVISCIELHADDSQ